MTGTMDIEKDIDAFKKDMCKIIHLFLMLKSKYEHDAKDVFQKLTIFKEYLGAVNLKYPAIEIVLDEHDLTTDDLKILLNKYISKGEIIRKFKLQELPVMIKKNDRHNKLQLFIDYDYADHSINETMEFLGVLAIENINRQYELELPKELELMCSGINQGAATAGHGGLSNK